MLEVVLKALFLIHVVTQCTCYSINLVRSDSVSRTSSLIARSTLFCNPSGSNNGEEVLATVAVDVDISRDESILDTLGIDSAKMNLDEANGYNEQADEEDIEDIEDIDHNPGSPKCYVIISNLQSGSNIGSICRNALAFNVHEVIVIGRKGFRDKMRNADRGAKRKQSFVHFNSILEAATYLKETKKCSIVGVEIMDSAVSCVRYSTA